MLGRSSYSRNRDRRLIYAASVLRSVAIGALGVFAAIYLRQIGYSLAAVGLVIGAGMVGGAMTTLAVGLRADAVIGRRRLLMLLSGIAAVGFLSLTLSVPPVVLAVLAFFGTVNAMGRDRGGLSALEQAMLPETTAPERRTWALAWYNLLLDVGHALGALAGAIPAILVSVYSIGTVQSYRIALAGCAIAMLAGVALYAGLSRQSGAAPAASIEPRAPISDEARRRVRKLSLLFGIDSLGGGFLSSALVAYWFFERYGLNEQQIAMLFFAARALNALSHLGAAWLASRIGLVNTMVFTHLPSSLFLMAAPISPTAGLAAGLFLAREGLVEMDVPTRQSYVLAIVRPHERTYASGVTNLTRNLAWAAGPFIAGYVMQHIVLAGPLFIGGSLKIVYDLVLYRSFRHIRPPEEETR